MKPVKYLADKRIENPNCMQQDAPVNPDISNLQAPITNIEEHLHTKENIWASLNIYRRLLNKLSVEINLTIYLVTVNLQSKYNFPNKSSYLRV